jgi:hypothetical protein
MGAENLNSILAFKYLFNTCLLSIPVEGHSTTSTTCSSTTSTATKLTTLRSSPTTSTAKTTTAVSTSICWSSV